MRILIVEDEEALAQGLKFNVEQEGYDACVVGDGPSALKVFQQGGDPIDLVVLDLMLPGMSGYEICRRIREFDQEVPILVLSARTLTEDRTLAFDAGTDQYMAKPFALPELLSRIRNLTERRAQQRSAAAKNGKPGDVRRFGSVTVDFAGFRIAVGERTHNLTTLEMQLLRYFLEHEGVVLSRARLLEDVWKDDSAISSRTIDNFVMRLRKLIESDPSDPRHILSVRGTGYKFVSEPDRAT